MALLELKGISARYGMVQALFGISLTVEEGEIVCLIGPNGAGKTTTIRTITGALRPFEGEVSFLGKNITKARTSAIIRSGISVVPEGRRVFPKMTVKENLELGAYVVRKDKEGFEKTLKTVYELFPQLETFSDRLAGTLSGGEQEMLAISRAMMSRPKLMLLDEPSMGLAPVLVEKTFQAIQALNKAGTTILLIEQNANMALSISHRGYVLEGGNIELSGSALQLRASDEVKDLYLGGQKS